MAYDGFRPYDQENPDSSSLRKRPSAFEAIRPHARAVVQESLLKEFDDPDGFMLDTVGWDEFEDFLDFAQSVLFCIESLV